MNKIRLDQWLVNKNYFSSRAKAQEAIANGHVKSDKMVDLKSSLKVDDTFTVTVNNEMQRYVSRAAYKLLAAIKLFNPKIQDGSFLDIGASTGGFTQILLEYGAKQVTAIDVGHDQFSPLLINDPRVTLHEGVNARFLNTTHLNDNVDGVVADVSFISLKLALPPALNFVKNGGFAILLVKPQFESEKKFLNKQGVITCEKTAQAIAEELKNWLSNLPYWQNVKLEKCPLKGKNGNQEFILFGIKNATK
ncbi:TlyA family RNA methyltransferase [Bartonella sp. DGB1]|uniref:TlyA family RNA methyltransferase n=1 Tax=Bartonella sp. DGB1 TaxID=3239807 RepID=UPI0035267B56